MFGTLSGKETWMYKDNFFVAIRCDRCGRSLESGRIMSMYNDDVICMDCKEEEMKKENYNDAVQADIEAIRKGDYNFKGIGYESVH
jgi:hypothetical protein